MKRFAFPDLLKGFAVFLIIPVHILELFIDYSGRESLFGKTILFLGGPFAVPVFMIIMGYFVAKSEKSLAKNSLRAIKVFVVGIMLNIALNFNLLLKIKFHEWQINPLEYIFGVDILFLASLSIFILSFLKIFKNRAVWVAFLLIFIVSGLTGYMNETLMITERNYAIPLIGGNYSWAYFPLFPWFTYPLIGFVFYYWEKQIIEFIKKQKIVSGFIFAIITALVILFAKPGIEITIDLFKYYHHEFWTACWIIGVVIFWVAILRLFYFYFPNTYLGDFLKWLGKNITLFYVIQWLIIGNIATAIYQTQSINHFFYWFAGIFTVTVFLTWLLEKTGIKLAR